MLFRSRTFNSNPDGSLYQTDEILLHVSPVNSYHNGSTEGNPAAGRQRWGDYSSVTLDPDNEKNFWVVGEYAETFNNTAGGHPGGSGGSRWGTWIADIDLTGQVPEPKSLALMLIGLLAFGMALARKTNRV